MKFWKDLKENEVKTQSFMTLNRLKKLERCSYSVGRPSFEEADMDVTTDLKNPYLTLFNGFSILPTLEHYHEYTKTHTHLLRISC